MKEKKNEIEYIIKENRPTIYFQELGTSRQMKNQNTVVKYFKNNIYVPLVHPIHILSINLI